MKSLNFIKLEGNNLSSEVPRFVAGLNGFATRCNWFLSTKLNFRGKLPDSIGNLKAMTNLLLCMCNFSGSIRPSLAHLTNVAEIDISYNKFEGSIELNFKDFSI
ncbi:hypothetical protein MIMGU_mgv11b022238mg [Erythranthe guttata]|uniref:Leucine-rich repeat-containing N-terminal plant-type domain-containing protein n=1 Tax=Erythranthe guttata TaxID=4155 RepID=A0A022QCF4_ERYGU|nr:hypothetical protein MIMGU_mgv11b022238mg [Erythranthe guttata]